MRKRVWRRVTAIVLVAMMFVMCVACGDERDDSEKDAKPTTAQATPTDKPAKPTEAPVTPTDKPATPTETPVTPTETPVTPTEAPTQGTKELTGSSGTAPVTKAMDDTMREAYAGFAYKLFDLCSKGTDKNCLISPFSVYTALAMLANGADGNTLAQLDNLLGLTGEQRDAYMAAWIDALTKQESVDFSCADSVWVNNLFRENVLPEFLKRCADSYRAEVYAADMDDKTVDDVNAWTDRNTKGMIKKLLKYGDLNPITTQMILMNAIAMDAKWQSPFESDSVNKDATFTHEDGTTSKVEMMYGSADDCYLENELFTGCTKSYKGGEFRYVALLPKEGVSLSEAVASLNRKTIDELFAGAKRNDVNLGIPKYTVEYSVELGNRLKALGTGDMFSASADLSKLVNTPDSRVDRVIHKTYLALDNEGTRAAAVTAVLIKNEAISMSYSITLDRPFVYMIVDGNNLPLFIGTYR